MYWHLPLYSWERAHVLCYCVAVVMQGLLPLPKQTPLELEEMGSWAVHVTGVQGGIWGLSFQKQSEEALVPSYIGSCALLQVMEETVSIIVNFLKAIMFPPRASSEACEGLGKMLIICTWACIRS